MRDHLDNLGHAAYVALIAGQLLIAWECGAAGWVLRVAGEATWAWIGWRMGMASIWLWSTVFAVVDIVGLVVAWL